jgi:NitT/TauT family transport system substrate-binding protein
VSVGQQTREDLVEGRIEGAVDLAVLPEPMVTIAVNSAAKASITLKVDLDLTAAWDRLENKANTLVQGCVVVRTEFLESHPVAVNDFLSAYKESIAYLNENVDDAAQLIQEHEIFANAGVAKQAIPKCNVKYVDGKDMKNAVSIYLEILNGINSQSIGGAIPGDDFYYHAND